MEDIQGAKARDPKACSLVESRKSSVHTRPVQAGLAQNFEANNLGKQVRVRPVGQSLSDQARP
jgi:hypothetical protein